MCVCVCVCVCVCLMWHASRGGISRGVLLHLHNLSIAQNQDPRIQVPDKKA